MGSLGHYRGVIESLLGVIRYLLDWFFSGVWSGNLVKIRDYFDPLTDVALCNYWGYYLRVMLCLRSWISKDCFRLSRDRLRKQMSANTFCNRHLRCPYLSHINSRWVSSYFRRHYIGYKLSIFIVR